MSDGATGRGSVRHYVDRERVLAAIDAQRLRVQRDVPVQLGAVEALAAVRARVEALQVVTRGR